jgi:hypothetical protein
MRRHPGRLVDGEKGFVFVKDRERLARVGLPKREGREVAPLGWLG